MEIAKNIVSSKETIKSIKNEFKEQDGINKQVKRVFVDVFLLKANLKIFELIS
jgi:hypothetical protein